MLECSDGDKYYGSQDSLELTNKEEVYKRGGLNVGMNYIYLN